MNIDGSGLNDDFIPLDTGVTPYGIAVNANYIYWEEEEYEGPNLEETIARANINGSGVDNDFISDGGTQGGVAVNADYIYYSLGNDIGRANLDGSDPDSDFITTSGEEDVAVDSNYIYWASDGSSIGRANLDGTDVDDSFITGGHQTSGVAGGGAASYEISGETYQANCSNTVCAMPTPVPDTTVSVKSLDGGSVNTSDVTDDDGDWSSWSRPVTISSHRRGATIGSRQIGTSPSTRTHRMWTSASAHRTAARARTSAVRGDVAPDCVGPDRQQRKQSVPAAVHDPGGSLDPGAIGSRSICRRHERGRHRLSGQCPRVHQSHRFLPAVPEPDGVQALRRDPPRYALAIEVPRFRQPDPVSPGWGSVTVPISSNGITGASEVRNITTTPGKLTRQYDYETQLASGTSHGTCGVPREMDPLVRATILSSSTNDDTGTLTATFELDISWPIPFKPFEDLADVKDFNDAILAPFTKQAQADLEKKIEQLPGYSSLPPLAKSKLKIWGVAIAKVGQGGDRARRVGVEEGLWLPVEPHTPPIKLGKKAIDILKKLAYGAADARITGTFLTHFGAIDYRRSRLRRPLTGSRASTWTCTGPRNSCHGRAPSRFS